VQRVLQAADGEGSAQAVASGAEFEHWIKHGSAPAAEAAAGDKGAPPVGTAAGSPAAEV
jgi:hypothetical protein